MAKTLSQSNIVVNYVIDPSGLDLARAKFDGITSAEAKTISETKRLQQAIVTAGKEGAAATEKVSKEMGNLTSLAKTGAGILAGFFAIGQIKAMGAEILSLTAKYESYRKVLDFTTGSNRAGGEAFQFLIETSRRLGISLDAAISGFKTLSGASAQAGIGLKQQKEIFENVSKAVSAFGLSAEDSKGVFLALGQIISKGTVQAEELRGQIGERIPGAFAIAARSMGVTERELNKLLQTGKVLSKDFIIPFAAELGKVSEAAAGQDGLQKNINRLSNAFELLKTRAGEALLSADGFFSNFGRGLQIVLDKINDTTASNSVKRQQQSYEAINATIEKYGKVSDEAIQNEINKRGQAIRELEKYGKASLDAVNEQVKNGKKLSKEDLITMEAIAKGRKESFDRLNDERIALSRIQKQRKEDAEEAARAEAVLTKAQYDAELKRLQLLTEIRKLEQPDKESGLGADVAFLKAKQDLQIRGQKAGLDITNEEIALTKAARTKAGEDLIQEQSKRQKESIDLLNDYRKERAELEKQTVEHTLKQAKIVNIAITSGEREEEDNIRKREAVKRKLVEDSVQGITQIYQGFLNLRLAQLDNELVASRNLADEQIRLADGNEQKINTIRERQRAKEKEIRTQQFKAQQQAAIANAIFQAVPEIVKYAVDPITVPLAILGASILAAQIAFIAAQPIPAFAKGTESSPEGPAIVGEKGSEVVIDPHGNAYMTPDRPTLVNLKRGSRVIPHEKVSLTESFEGNRFSKSTGTNEYAIMGEKLDRINNTLSKLPIHQTLLDKKGFETFIRRPNSVQKVLNNQFGK